MAEQWPFKPFVEGSSPPELTKKSSVFGGLFCLLSVPAGGMIFESPRAHKKVFRFGGLFCLLSICARMKKKSSFWEDFFALLVFILVSVFIE